MSQSTADHSRFLGWGDNWLQTFGTEDVKKIAALSSDLRRVLFDPCSFCLIEGLIGFRTSKDPADVRARGQSRRERKSYFEEMRATRGGLT